MKIIISCFLCSLYFISYSQDNCSDILKDGVRDSYGMKTSYYQEVSYMIDISKWSYSEFQTKYNAGLTFPIKGIPMNANMGLDKYRSAQQQINQKLEFYNLTDHDQEIFILSANTGIIQAWKECMLRKTGEFQLIVNPIDVINGKYDLSYHWTYYPSSNPKFLGVISDENLLINDPNNELSGEIRPNSTAVIRLTLKDPSKSAVITVKSTLGDKSFYIPGYKELKPIVASEGSIQLLKTKIEMLQSSPKRISLVPTGKPHCTVEADEFIRPENLTINRSLTKLHYTYTCIRNNTRWECDGGWVNVGSDNYSSSATADLEYAEGVLYIKNIQVTESKTSECGTNIINHLKRMSGMSIKMEFVQEE